MRKLIFMLCALCFNAVMGATVSTVAFGGSACAGAVVANVLAAVAGHAFPDGVLRAGLLKEIWTAEMIRAFRPDPNGLGWYDRIRSYDQYVNNDVIHFVEIGGDPAVLVNNTTYPLRITDLDDADKPVSLDKFDTEATPVSDDELHAISYDKMASVLERHRDALKYKILEKAIHAIAPDSNSAGNTPVLATTGTADGARLRMCFADLLAAKKEMDAMKTPKEGRIMVLTSEHVNDLLLTEQKFREQYNINQTEGKIARLYGFDIYEYDGTPSYNGGTKKAFGAVAASGDKQASVFFYLGSMMKANGSVSAYSSEAGNDPLYHRNLVNFRKWSICLPLKANKTRGAILSGTASN